MIRLSIDQRSLSALASNFYSLDERIRKDALEAAQEHGQRTYQRAYELAPKDTGFMSSQLRLDYSEGGYVFAVGYREEDFTSQGLYPYFLVQEFGSSTQSGTPHLAPAARDTFPEYQAALTKIFRQSVQNFKRR